MYRSTTFRELTARLLQPFAHDDVGSGWPQRRSWDLTLVIAATLLALIAIATGWQPLRWIFAAPLVFVLPGYALVAAVLGGRAMAVPERLLLSLGASVAVTIVGGVLLNLTPWGLRTPTWAIGLGCLTLAACVVALARRNAYRSVAPVAMEQDVSDGPHDRRPMRVGVRQLVLLGVAVAALSGAVLASRVGAIEQPAPGYTQLWMLPSPGSAQTSSAAAAATTATTAAAKTVQLGIKNMEAKSMTYKLALLVNGKTARIWSSIRIQPGASWQISVVVPGAPSSTATVEAVLYRMDAPQTIYRHVELQPGS